MLRHLLRGLAPIALTLSAIGTANAADKIVIGMASGINQLPSLVAHAKGFFKEQGLDVENKPVARGAVALGAVAGGSLQFAEVGACSVHGRGLEGHTAGIGRHCDPRVLRQDGGVAEERGP